MKSSGAETDTNVYPSKISVVRMTTPVSLSGNFDKPPSPFLFTSARGVPQLVGTKES